MRDLRDVLADLASATRHLVDDAARLAARDLAQPSLLPSWTRAHVLAHLAQNADAGVRLIDGARTGTPGFEYASVAARAAAIEQGAQLPAAVLLKHLGDSAQRFHTSCLAMTATDWEQAVTWTTGQQTTADAVPRSRLTEVLVHHVDLDLGYSATAWPHAFVRERLDAVIGSLNRRALAPETLRLVATDSSRTLVVNGAVGQDARTVTGTETQLLVWLLGRSAGAELQVSGGGPLPELPSTYTT